MSGLRLLALGALSSTLLAAPLVACGDDAPPAASLVAPSTSGGTSGVSGGTDSSSGIVPTEGGVTPETDGGSDSAAPACTGPAYGAGTVNARAVTDSIPVDLGGTIMPGTYDLTDYEFYVDNPDPEGTDAGGGVAPAAPNASARGTLVLGATSYEGSVALTDDGVTTESAVRATYSTLDAQLALTELCPSTDVVKTAFTATGNTLTLHAETHRRLIYTRRP